MSFKIGSSGGGAEFEKPALGAHIAVLADAVDIGLQKTPYTVESGPRKGEPKTVRQAVLFFELNSRNQTGEFAGKRFIKTATVTASLYNGSGAGSASKLFNIVTALNSGIALTDEQIENEFDLSTMVGRCCMIYLQDSDDAKFRYISRVEALQNQNDSIHVEEQYGKDNFHPWLVDKIAARLDTPSTLPTPMADDADGGSSPFQDQF